MRIIFGVIGFIILALFVLALKALDVLMGLETPDWLLVIGGMFICLGISSLNFPKE